MLCERHPNHQYSKGVAALSLSGAPIFVPTVPFQLEFGKKGKEMETFVLLAS